jgi:amino acid transporter
MAIKNHWWHWLLIIIIIVTMMDVFFCYCSTKESSILNLIMTVFHVIFFGFIIFAGFSHRTTNNLVKPGWLTPKGVRSLLDGAAIVYFSFIGYNSISAMAEEIQSPSKSLLVGIVGSVLIVSVLYCLMALSLCMMVPYTQVSNLNFIYISNTSFVYLTMYTVKRRHTNWNDSK